MPELAAIVSTFTLAFFYFWAAIPAGLALGLAPLVVIATTSLSYISGAALVVFVGGRVREWVMKRLGKERVLNPDSLLGKAWARFGVIGLGLLAPMTIGSQAGAAVAIALGSPPRKAFLWLCVGGIAWSVLLTVLVSVGMLVGGAVS